MENRLLVRAENAEAVNKLLDGFKLPWKFVYLFSEIKDTHNKAISDWKQAYNSIQVKYLRMQEKAELEYTGDKDKDGNAIKVRKLTADQQESRTTEIDELDCREITVKFPTVPMDVFEEIYKTDSKELEELKKKDPEKEIDMSKYITANDITCYISLGIATKGEPNAT